MNPEVVLAVLPNTRDEAKSIKEIALALGLDIYSYIAAKTKRQLSRTSGDYCHPALEATKSWRGRYQHDRT